MKKIKADTLRRIIWQKHRVDCYALFYELSQEQRHEIITEVFEASTNYRLIPGKGLVEKDGTDVFSGYTDFSHLKSVEALAFDINQTNKASKDMIGRHSRAIILRKKQAFEKRKQERIAESNAKEHLLKWEPQDAITRAKLERLRKYKKEQQNKEFDR